MNAPRIRAVTMDIFVASVTNISTVTTLKVNKLAEAPEVLRSMEDMDHLICKIYRQVLNIKEFLRGTFLTHRAPARLALSLERSQQSHHMA